MSCKNKLPEKNIKVQHKGWIAKECQQILNLKGTSLIYSFWNSTTRQRAPKIFSACVGGKMMRGGFCQFQDFARNDQRLKGFVSDTGIKSFLWFDEKTEGAAVGIVMQFTTTIHLARRLSFNPVVAWRILNDQPGLPIKIGEIYWSAHRTRRSHMARLKLEEKKLQTDTIVWYVFTDQG